MLMYCTKCKTKTSCTDKPRIREAADGRKRYHSKCAVCCNARSSYAPGAKLKIEAKQIENDPDSDSSYEAEQLRRSVSAYKSRQKMKLAEKNASPSERQPLDPPKLVRNAQSSSLPDPLSSDSSSESD